MIDYWERYDEDDENLPIKKQQRNDRKDRIQKSREQFMRINGRGLISDVLPTLEKRAKEKKK